MSPVARTAETTSKLSPAAKHPKVAPPPEEATLWRATSSLAASFASAGQQFENVACGTENVLACLATLELGCSDGGTYSSALSALVGQRSPTGRTWLQKSGRFLGVYIKEAPLLDVVPDFCDKLGDIGAEVWWTKMEEPFDEVINRAVAAATNDKIKQIVGPADVERATMVVLAADYLDLEWSAEFPPFTNELFYAYSAPTSPIACPMMRIEDGQLHYTDLGEAELVLIPTKGETAGTTSLVYGAVLLPKAEGKAALAAAMHKLAGVEGAVGQCLAAGTQPVTLAMPRLLAALPATEITELLKHGLYAAGLYADSAVDAAVETAAREPANRTLDKVFHATFLKVDEQGAEAAAVTAAVVTYRSLCVDDTPVVTCNRPYAFCLINADRRGDTGFSVLFSMVVTDGGAFDFAPPSGLAG